MKSIQFRLLVAALAVLLGTTIAHSQTADTSAPPPPMPGMHAHGHGFGMAEDMMGFFADYLNLSDAQQAQMKGIMQKEHANLKPLIEEMRQTRQQIHQYEEGTFDEASVRKLATQKAQTQIELTVAETRIHNELFQVLTADQQAKMKEFEARRAARMEKHMHDAPPAPPQQ